MQFYEVEFGAVTFVLAEAILRETRAEVAHNRIAGDLCDHARGRNTQAVTIAVDDCGLGERERKNRQAIDQDMLRLKGESRQREVHRLVGRTQNIDRVDLDGIDNSHRPRERVVGQQFVVDGLPFFRQELLRIVQLPVPEFLRENHGGSYHRTGERAAPRFVDSGDGRNSEGAQLALMPETAAAIHRRENTEKPKN